MAADRFDYDSHGRRNPFLPPPAKEGPAVDAGGAPIIDTEPYRRWFGERMSGVLYEPSNPRVLIGDEIVEVGQEVNNCKVVEIRPDGIAFEYMGKRVEVPLRQEIEKEKK